MAEASLKGVQVYLFLGRTGAGKSKIAAATQKKLGIPSISLGQLARGEIAKDSALGLELKGFVKAGRPFPSNTAVKLLEQKMLASPAKYKKGVIFDNFPMSVRHVEIMEDMLKRHGMNLNTVFHINAPLKTVKGRRKERGQREGASLEAREKTFAKETARVLQYYKKKGKLRVIDASRPVRQSVGVVNRAAKGRKGAAKRPVSKRRLGK